MIDSPATGPPAAAESEYNTLLRQKAAVVLLLSTTVSKIKHGLVMKMPSLSPYKTLKAIKLQYFVVKGSIKAARPAITKQD